ncbi:general secretion pathway protein GspN [Luteimonas arsenica]|uniref:general secretion pathway protein GspN n=1 Tax=Luteimonas arsenica TaxID=1586242 RepID=UPI001055B1B9|nr:general secretion pathway protein GspN [Luteimonas arsenica]
MRAESAGAKTWLLGGVALWALVAWLLGLFGLGGRIDRLPPDPALVQALPTAAQPGEDRLGPLAQYAESADRPLFTSDRRPQPFFINPVDEEAPAEFEYVLTSVLLVPGLEVAIVQPAAGGESVRLKVGESAEGAPGWQLSSISPRGAVFDGPGGQRTLELRVFDGVGGEAPTAMSTPPPAAAAPQGRPRAEEPANGNRPVVVTTSSQPAPTEVEVPPQQDAAAAPEAEPEPPTARTSEDQVEAIRARIEARRARLREQAQQGQ